MCKIVVIDERKDILDSIYQDLSKKFTEHKILKFKSTKETLEQFKTFKNIDILIFNSLYTEDPAVPNGLDFATIIRKQSAETMMFYIEEDKKVKPEYMLKLAEIGIDGYITFPYNKNMLYTIIINALSRQKTFKNIKCEKYEILTNSIDSIVESWNMYLDNVDNVDKEAINQSIKPNWKTKIYSLFI